TACFPLSLHDALPIFLQRLVFLYQVLHGLRKVRDLPLERTVGRAPWGLDALRADLVPWIRVLRQVRLAYKTHVARRLRLAPQVRSEEHTSELQSRENL